MKPTLRQQAQIDNIVREEVQRGLQARSAKRALLRQAELNELRLADPRQLREGVEGELVASLYGAIDDLVTEFTKANKWDAAVQHATGASRDAWAKAVKEAAQQLRSVVDDAVREVEQGLMEGMYAPVEG